MASITEDPFSITIRHILFGRFKTDLLPQLTNDFYWTFNPSYDIYYLHDKVMKGIILSIDAYDLAQMGADETIDHVTIAIQRYKASIWIRHVRRPFYPST